MIKVHCDCVLKTADSCFLVSESETFDFEKNFFS